MTSADMRRAFLGLLLLLAVPAAAQVTTSKPIEVEAPKPKKLQFKGEVLTVSRVAITVRSLENANLVRTFTFSEKLAPKMAKQIDAARASTAPHPSFFLPRPCPFPAAGLRFFCEADRAPPTRRGRTFLSRPAPRAHPRLGALPRADHAPAAGHRLRRSPSGHHVLRPRRRRGLRAPEASP